MIRTHLRAIKCEQTKKIVVFAQWISQSMLTKLTAFKTSPEQLRYKHHQRPPEFGRGGAHLPFGFNLAQFEGL